eukprot:4595554-Pleurochrysis_carterae.AAC.4
MSARHSQAAVPLQCRHGCAAGARSARAERACRVFFSCTVRSLGAFEVDARQRVDGECVDINLWSKLHTKLWPVWPDWQHMLHALLPVFFLRLRPCAMFADGS